MDDNVLVTGSSGMVGTALVERLLNEGTTVYGVSRSRNRWSEQVEDRTVHVDLTDEDAASEALPRDIDTIVHLAGASRVGMVAEDPTLARVNVETTSTVLEHARDVDANVVFASSREVYGHCEELIRGESRVDVRAARNPYGASKVAGEALVQSYDATYESVRAATLRLTNVYGRYDASDRLVPKFVARAGLDRELIVYDESTVRGFLHVDDCVDALTRSIDSFDRVRGQVLNVSPGRIHSLVDIAEKIVEVTESESTISLEGDREQRGDRYVLDTSAIKAVLGWKPEYDLASGIEKTVSWYLDRPELLEELA